MQINQQELDVQFVELLPERETLFFNFQGNWGSFEINQTSQVLSFGGDASGGSNAQFEFNQSNSNG